MEDKEGLSEMVYSTELKALEDAHGRFVEFDLITNDVDQSSQAADQQYDDLISPEAILSAERQLRGSIISVIDPLRVRDFSEVIRDGAKFGGVGHEHMYTNQDIVPALIIEDVKAIDKNTKLRVTAKINEHSQRANDVWAMIKGNVLKGASIEYMATKKHLTNVEGKVIRVIDDLVLSGYALTSKMRNSACGITGWFVKSLDSPTLSTEIIQEIKMAEEVKVEAPPVVVEAPKYDEQIKALQEQVKALVASNETLGKKLEEAKALESDKQLIDSLKGTLKEEIKSALEVEQKQLVEEEQKKFDQVKSAMEEIKAAKAKGIDAMWETTRQKHNELGGI